MKVKSTLKLSSFRDGIDEHSSLNPLLIALLIAIVYILLVSLYIYISGTIAARASTSVEKLKLLELSKGSYYTLVTGTILFLAAYFVFKKIAQQDDLIISQNKKMISTERLVLAGLFSSSICHDINNIMVVVVGNIELLEISPNIGPEDKTLLRNISRSSIRLIELVKRMMDAGKEHVPGTRSDENLSRIIQDTVDFAKVHRKIKTCNLQVELQPNVKSRVNSLLVSRTLMNLLLNAAEATNATGHILVRLQREGDYVVIEVHDNGPGIGDEIKEKIFEPFYTTKKDGNGLGLLSLKTCIQQHDGIIDIKKSHLGGACFSLTLPTENFVQTQTEPT